MNHIITWLVTDAQKEIRPLFRLNPCEAQITRHVPIRGWRKHMLYLIQPPSITRKSNAYQHIGTVTFEEFSDTDTCVALCVQYLRVAEVKFGVTITRVMFRRKEVTNGATV